MGQVKPQPPPAPPAFQAQGPPKAVKPLASPCAQALCPYCRRFGALGRCDGCGGNNQPYQQTPRAVEVPPFTRTWAGGRTSSTGPR